MNDKDLSRFMSKIKICHCWQWLGSLRSGGYGQFYLQGKIRRAHIVSYEHFVGPIPANLQLDHLCRNRRCVRPSHLEPVTQQTNLLRGNTIPAKNAKKAACPLGHPYQGRNTRVSRRNQRSCRECVNRQYREWYSRNREKKIAQVARAQGYA